MVAFLSTVAPFGKVVVEGAAADGLIILELGLVEGLEMAAAMEELPLSDSRSLSVMKK